MVILKKLSNFLKPHIYCFYKSPGLYILNIVTNLLKGDFVNAGMVNYSSKVIDLDNIHGAVDSKVFLKSLFKSQGVYINASNGIHLGTNLLIAPNVGIVSSKHSTDKEYSRVENVSSIRIGDYCWLGMGSIILPEVELGDRTIVAAGAIVTKSFRQGYCVLAGTPAKIVKKLPISSSVK